MGLVTDCMHVAKTSTKSLFSDPLLWAGAHSHWYQQHWNELINTDSSKETEGSQENPAADSRAAPVPSYTSKTLKGAAHVAPSTDTSQKKIQKKPSEVKCNSLNIIRNACQQWAIDGWKEQNPSFFRIKHRLVVMQVISCLCAARDQMTGPRPAGWGPPR